MYVYLHQNGNYIKKVDCVVNSIGATEYFNSPFVVKYWHFDTKERAEEFIECKSKNK